MELGWIKIHRQILNWEWYDEPNTFRIFFHLLLKANHKPNKYRGVTVEAGQIMTGLDLLARETNLSMQKVRTSLNRLKSTNEITIKTSTKGTIIQVVNYEKYQVVTNEQQTNNKRVTNEQQTNNKQITTNKNVNNIKNEKNEENINKALPFSFYNSLIDYGFKKELVSDWLKVRKLKKSANTETAFKGFINQVEKSNIEKNEILKTCIEKSWSGFKSDWYIKENKTTSNNATSKIAF